MNISTASEAEHHAEKLRRELAGTLDKLVNNLTPRRLASEAVATARDNSPDWLVRYWAFAQSPAGLAIIGGVASAGLAGAVAVRRRSMQRRRR